MSVKSVLFAFAVLLFSSLSSSAAYIQSIDNFESGTLDLSKWDIDQGDATHADVFNAISAFYENGEGPKLYYPSEGSWMLVASAGDPVTKLSTHFTTSPGGTFGMQVFFSGIEGIVPWATMYNDVGRVLLDGNEVFFADVLTVGSLGTGMDNTGWVSLSKPLSAGKHTLEILVENGGGDFNIDSQLAVDNIRVTYATAPVPEPSTWAMLAVGLGLLGITIHRKETRKVTL